MTTICFISDLHANSRALHAALDRVDDGPCDHLVIGGDLLTYGVDLNETLDLVSDLQASQGATLLMGNHDQLYFDLAEGRTESYSKLPAWVRESVDWTVSRLDLADFITRFSWRDDFVIEDLLFAHANPFGYGDWRYLNDEASHRLAAIVLRGREMRAGIFGHTHRACAYRALDDGEGEWIDVSSGPFALLRNHSRLVLNSGSIGQPRGSTSASTFLRLTTGSGDSKVLIEEFAYDVQSHVASILSAELSQATRERLCLFFN